MAPMSLFSAFVSLVLCAACCRIRRKRNGSVKEKAMKATRAGTTAKKDQCNEEYVARRSLNDDALPAKY